MQRFQRLSGQRFQAGFLPRDGVLHHPVGGDGRQLSGQGVIDCGGHGIDVRPRAGAAPLGILLKGAEAALGDLHGGRAIVDAQVLCRAQIQNLYLAVRRQHQVVRADVTVDKASLMHLLHGLNGGKENGFSLFPRQRAGLFQPRFQRFALHEVHDDVGCLVFLKKIPHPYHVGDIVHFGHFPCLFQEHLRTVLFRLLGLHTGVPRQSPGAGIPADLTGRVVFLDGDLPFQRDIPADVGDAEAALTQHPADQIFPREDRSHGQGVLDSFDAPRVEAAVGAGIALNFLHAAKTTVEFHISLSFLRGFLPLGV